MAEISEPTTAVALLFGKQELRSVFTSIYNGPGGDIEFLTKWWGSSIWQNYLKDSSTILGLPPADKEKLLPSKLRKGIKEATTDKQIKAAKTLYYNSMSDVAVGVSAALAIYKWLDEYQGSSDFGGQFPISKIYITGSTWHSDIQKFQVPYAGMKDFNSADIVIRTHPLCFFGVSIKKKYTHKKTDPTMINRSITKVLKEVNKSRVSAEPYEIDHPDRKKKGEKIKNPSPVATAPAAEKLLDELATARHGVYQRIVKDQTFRDKVFEQEGVYVPLTDITSGIPLYRHYWKDTYTDHTDDKLKINAAIRKKYKITKDSFKGVMPIETKSKALINFKGSGGQQSVRKYVNSKLAADNKYFAKIKDILFKKPPSKITTELAEELTDHVLKLSLPEKLSSNSDLKNYHFGFCLCTGIAELDGPHTLTEGQLKKYPKGKVTIDKGKAIDTSSILCVLSKYFGKGTTKEDYYFKLRAGTGKAAEIGIDMWKKVRIKAKGSKVDRHILWMTMRYKGNFLNPPDFQGRLSDNFSTLLKGACDPDESH